MDHLRLERFTEVGSEDWIDPNLQVLKSVLAEDYDFEFLCKVLQCQPLEILPFGSEFLNHGNELFIWFADMIYPALHSLY